MRWEAKGRALVVGTECLDRHHANRGPVSDIGWEMYPPGLTSVLERFSRLVVPLMVTENGVATTDEALRTTFLRAHVRSLGEAMRGGEPVIGYLHWSLIDNFEWSLGMTARFGLCAVDGRTQIRTPRPAAGVYADVCRRNEVVGPQDPT